VCGERRWEGGVLYVIFGLVKLPDEEEVVGGWVIGNEGLPVSVRGVEGDGTADRMGFVKALRNDAPHPMYACFHLVDQHW
jgi:hypothetical protein